MNYLKSCIKTLPLILLLVSTQVCLAADKTPLKALQYPELQVSPLASQRLKMEAESEESLRWKNSLYYVSREGVRDCQICGVAHVQHRGNTDYRALVELGDGDHDISGLIRLKRGADGIN